MPFTGPRRLTGKKTGKKRRVSDAKLLALENARKKKRANKDVKQRKELLLERKKKLNRMRQGKTYGLLVWATDELMGTQVHKEVDPALCKKYIKHAEKELLQWLYAERNSPEVTLKPELQQMIHKVDILKGIKVSQFQPFFWDFYKSDLHGHISDLTKGVRSVVDSKGNFVTSREAAVEDEEIVFEGIFEENAPQFEKIDIEEDSEDELAGDELEASMDAFLLEYFAEEHWISANFVFLPLNLKSLCSLNVGYVLTTNSSW